MADSNVHDSPAELKARQQINELLSDRSFRERYYNKSHAGHRDAVKQLEQLMVAGNPKPGIDRTRGMH